MNTHAASQLREKYSKNRTVALGGSVREKRWLRAAFGECWVQGSRAIRIRAERMPCCPLDPLPCDPPLSTGISPKEEDSDHKLYV